MRYKRHKIKITREDLKHDGFVDFISKCVELYNVNRLKILTVTICVGLVLISGLAYRVYLGKVSDKASFALYEAANVGDMEAVFDRFPGTDAGRIALYLSATSYVKAGDTGKALGLFEKFINRYPSDYLIPNAMISVSCIKMDSGRGNEALDLLGRLVDEYPFSYVAPEALIYKGMILEQEGNLHEALIQYKKIAETYPGSFWVNDAEQKISILGSNLKL
ncbi:MAG: tetratricopeptide repeat protein [Candidatus Aureabacteria bacterium]|nr:tetratricopeptide repeat protein [Candidatus Auribacterota bacterium]